MVVSDNNGNTRGRKFYVERSRKRAHDLLQFGIKHTGEAVTPELVQEANKANGSARGIAKLVSRAYFRAKPESGAEYEKASFALKEAKLVRIKPLSAEKLVDIIVVHQLDSGELIPVICVDEESRGVIPELFSSPQRNPSYKAVAQELAELTGEVVAGKRVTKAMKARIKELQEVLEEKENGNKGKGQKKAAPEDATSDLAEELDL